MFKSGIAGSDGIGIGKAFIIKSGSAEWEEKSSLSAADETARFDAAVDAFVEKTNVMADAMRENVGEKESEILMGHILMISDPSMTDEIRNKIGEGLTAEAASAEVLDMFAMIFEGTDDELTKQRAADIRDIKTRLTAILCGAEETDISALPPNSVIVAHDLTPSMTAGINKQNVVAIVTETGGRTSHSAILARALEIPAVLSIDGFSELVKDGDSLIVDGTRGEVIVGPSAEEQDKYTALKKKYDDEKRELLKFKGKPTVTADGGEVELVCNIGNPEDCAAVVENSGEGIGLFRTEFLYMNSSEAPDEETQFEAYKKAAMTMQGKPVIIRTLDVGGDKDIPYLNMEKEENPFMGFRAVRYCVAHTELYKTQLRALLRAGAYGDIKIMIPLVTCVDELRAVKAMIKSIMKDLDAEGKEYNKNIEVGVMIETPAAAVIADVLAKEADFFSIGTNDLTGYTMAVDRGNSKVAYLYSAYNLSVIRSLKRIIECGLAEGKKVGMCGEAAADPLLAPLLISFGLSEYSVSPSSVLKTRRTLSLWSKAEADKVGNEALACATEEEIREVLTKHAK